MDLAQYGITFPVILLFISLGIITGRLWKNSLRELLSSPYSLQKQLEYAVIVLFIVTSSLVFTYVLVGGVLLSFVYGAITSGILGEWVGELLYSCILLWGKSFNKPLSHINVGTSLHTLPEAEVE